MERRVVGANRLELVTRYVKLEFSFRFFNFGVTFGPGDPMERQFGK